MKKLGLLVGVLVVAGCAQTPLKKQTSSGFAEATFHNVAINDVKNRLVLGCNRAGMSIREASSNKVVCSKTMEGMGAIMTQVAIGNQYSTTPDEIMVFQLAQIDSDTHVGVRNYRETQMAFGQMSRVELKNNKTTNAMQELLDKVATEFNSKQEKPLLLQTPPPMGNQ